jgi:hypothetical protein
MQNYKIKQLEKLGKLQRKKVPNFTHKYTQEEYNSILQEIKQKLTLIQNMLKEKLNRVQNEILKICYKKILDVFRYYMNIRTWKINKQKNREFKKYIRELRNFKKKYFGTEMDERSLIDNTIDELVHKFIKQRNYIMEIEKKIRNNNISPFEDTIEILDNSIRRVVQ